MNRPQEINQCCVLFLFFPCCLLLLHSYDYMELVTVIAPLAPADAALPVSGSLVAGSYSYMQDLQALEATATGQGPRSFQPATPLRLQEWQQALRQHPDKCFANYILGGISKGFHIGVSRPCALTASRQGNLPSAREHNRLVAQHIAAERSASRLLGPVPPGNPLSCQPHWYYSQTTTAREVEINCRPLFAAWRECERWHLGRGLPHALCIGARRSWSDSSPRQRCHAGQDGFEERLSRGPSPR